MMNLKILNRNHLFVTYSTYKSSASTNNQKSPLPFERIVGILYSSGNAVSFLNALRLIIIAVPSPISTIELLYKISSSLRLHDRLKFLYYWGISFILPLMKCRDSLQNHLPTRLIKLTILAITNTYKIGVYFAVFI